MDDESTRRLRRNLDAMDENALVALSNRGLVRRAAKDLEQAGAYRWEKSDAAIVVYGDGWCVTMPPEGPVRATDDTPASGITRQILAATIFLRDHWKLEGDEPEDSIPAPASGANDVVEIAMRSAADRLVQSTAQELMKWSGKTPMLEAVGAIEQQRETHIHYSPQLKVDFAEAGVQVMLVTDQPASSLRGLLDQFKVTANREAQARWVLTAVLALKRDAGQSLASGAELARELPKAIREDRLRISNRVCDLLNSLAAVGIGHPSTRVVERLRTAAVTAEAAYFPRLARLLSSLSDDVRLQIDRDAAADPHRMTRRLIVAWALAEAGTRPENEHRAELFGQARSDYVAVGDLELTGIGAHGWRTASGFEGISVYLWDATGQKIYTVSTSRAEGRDLAFSMHEAYRQGIGWSGGSTLEQLCRHRLTLSDVRANFAGRLSSSEKCRVVLGDRAEPDAIDFGEKGIRDWNELSPVVIASQPIGLKLGDPRSSLVVLYPSVWGQRWFDELEQAFVWDLHDVKGATLEVRVPWREFDEQAIGVLEGVKVERDRLTAILARIEVIGGRVRAYPITLFSAGTMHGDHIICPQFDADRLRSKNEQLLNRLRAKYKRQLVVDARIGDEDELALAEQDAAWIGNSLLGNVLYEVEAVLLGSLESGRGVLSASVKGTLSDCRDRLDALGVRPMVETLEKVLSGNGKGTLLRALYYVELMRQSMVLSQIS